MKCDKAAGCCLADGDGKCLLPYPVVGGRCALFDPKFYEVWR